MNGNPIPLDPFGADMEAIVIQQGGASGINDFTYWMIDEYRPAVYHFDSGGRLIERLVPEGTAARAGQPAGTYGNESLPGDLINRRRNRGFEALALDNETGTLYAFIQTPLANPNRAASDGSDVIRVVGIDSASGRVVSEYVYALEDLSSDARAAGRVDKIGDAAWIGGGKMYVLERDAGVGVNSKKLLFEVDLTGATNLRSPHVQLLSGKTLEQHSIDELASVGIRPVHKTKITNLSSIGYVAGDKPEGVTILPNGSVAVLNDNDFTLADVPVFDAETGQPITGGGVVFQDQPTPEVLGIIRFDQPNGLDTSDRDGGVHIGNAPVYGAYMPDATTSFQVNGETFYVTANEGDARDSDERIGDLELDPASFPNAEEIQSSDALGRLKVSAIDGDLDGDGDFDQLIAYGGRSFTIFDAYGNAVFDSGEMFEQVTSYFAPSFFNATNDENNFDNRSDDKGPEPEAATTGVINGRVYAFIGLERVGGIAIYDVTDPSNSEFVQYLNNRNFSADPTTPEVNDLGIEDIKFIPAYESPNGEPLLVSSNEVSGTITVFAINITTTLGDFDGDRDIDADDLELIGPGIFHGDLRFDVNLDGVADGNDFEVFTNDLFPVVVGDSNLDGVFDQTDFVVAMTAGEYQDGRSGNSGWSEGDWNGDGDYDSQDLIFALQSGMAGFVNTAVADQAATSNTPPASQLPFSQSASEQDEMTSNSTRRPSLFAAANVDDIFASLDGFFDDEFEFDEAKQGTRGDNMVHPILPKLDLI